MRYSRRIRVVGHALRLALFIFAGYWAVRFLLDTLSMGGWSPAAFFGLLLVTGALLLVWRSTLDLRKAIHKLRS